MAEQSPEQKARLKQNLQSEANEALSSFERENKLVLGKSGYPKNNKSKTNATMRHLEQTDTAHKECALLFHAEKTDWQEGYSQLNQWFKNIEMN